MLVKLDNGIKALHSKLDYQNNVINNLLPENADEGEFILPAGLSLPMETTSDMENMELALQETSFHRSLVLLLELNFLTNR